MPFCISTLSWGRWKDILTHGRFKWHLNEKDMEMICRALLVYCVKHYKGDEKIKSFIWELITPTKDGQAQTLQNHSGERWQGSACEAELLHFHPLSCVSPCCRALGASLSQIHFRMFLWERITILLGLPQNHLMLTCDILSTVGPFEVSYRPVLPTNLSVTGLPPLNWGLTPHAWWFVFCILLFCPSSTSACAFSCTVLLLPCA